MAEIALQRDNLPTQFQPEQTFNKLAQLDAIIELAKKTKNWEALEDAIDMKIEEQREFVRWWRSTVKHGGSR